MIVVLIAYTSCLITQTSTHNETVEFAAAEIPNAIEDLMEMESLELIDFNTLDILNQIDRILATILVSPKKEEQGNMIFTLTSLYLRIINKLELLISNYQTPAFDIVMSVKKQGGPQFLEVCYNMPLYRDTFKWCRYNITRFKDLMYEASKKWKYVGALVQEDI